MDPYCNIPAPCVASGCICFWSTGFWCQNWSPPGASPNTEEQSEHQIFGERTGPLFGKNTIDKPCIPEVKVKQRKPHALHKNTKASCFGQNVVHGKPIRKLLERVFPGVLPISEATRCLEVWLRVLESGFAFWAAFKSFFVHILQKLVCSMIFNVQTKQNYNVFKRKQNLCPVVSQVNLFQFSGISLSNAQSVFSFLLILPPCLQESDLLSSLF